MKSKAAKLRDLDQEVLWAYEDMLMGLKELREAQKKSQYVSSETMGALKRRARDAAIDALTRIQVCEAARRVLLRTEKP